MKLILTILIGIIVILVAYFIVGNRQEFKLGQLYSPSSTPAATSQETKSYQSKNLKFEIKAPSEFEFSDNLALVELKDNSGSIAVSRNGTNFSNLKDYLANFDSKRQLTASNTKELNINGLVSISRVVRFLPENKEQKSYYIYANNFVYIISTADTALYDELDQIAQSFRYIP